jgi:Fic family protein
MTFDPNIPHRLPLLPPTLNVYEPETVDLLVAARGRIGELNGYMGRLPNPMLLMSPAIIKESLASSEVENINTTILDVLQNQLIAEPERKAADKEVLRYREALMWGNDNLSTFSISSRLVQGIHEQLLPGGDRNYRTYQNGIKDGPTIIYTPPAADGISDLVTNLENYVNTDGSKIDPLIKCAVMHYQFEAIHPFGDGNGRTGRILMVLYLIKSGLLRYPTLYISGYVNRNKAEYYTSLMGVTRTGDWSTYLRFMLKGFHEQALQTETALLDVLAMYKEFQEYLRVKHKNLYVRGLADMLFSYPVINPLKLGELMEVHYTTASTYLKELAQEGIVTPVKFGTYTFYINKKLVQYLQKSA